MTVAIFLLDCNVIFQISVYFGTLMEKKYIHTQQPMRSWPLCALPIQPGHARRGRGLKRVLKPMVSEDVIVSRNIIKFAQSGTCWKWKLPASRALSCRIMYLISLRVDKTATRKQWWILKLLLINQENYTSRRKTYFWHYFTATWMFLYKRLYTVY